ncbi:MAG TPA: PAS domain S-box protein [Bacteroidales bacterium]|nr:PAS domain S-box protein [Bacteroidales bacterium]HPS49723.1 PAS domain S-box protein [Bacteroidales bacterium]
MKFKIPEYFPGWKYIAAFVFFSLMIILLGFINLKIQRATLVRLTSERLESISKYKAEEISNWIRERRSDANYVNRAGNMHEYVNRFIDHPEREDLRRYILDHIMPMKDNYGYEDILIVDSTGKIYISLTPLGDSLSSDAQMILLNSIKFRNAKFSSFYYCKYHNKIHIDFYSPVYIGMNDSTTLRAMLLLRVDPSRFIYPLIQSWPVSSHTSETLLVEVKDDSVGYLSELKHRPGSTLRLKLPLHNELLPAAMAAKGYTGFSEGIDYRGVRVFFYARHVSGTPWYMVSKTDQDEALEPLSYWWGRTLPGVLVMILLGLLVLYLIFLQRKKDHFRNLYKLESQRLILTQHYEMVMQRANDVILLLDEKGTITDCNERAMGVYGYSREELVGFNASKIIAPEAQPPYRQRLTTEPPEEGFLYDSIHVKKDGTRFPVEVSSRVIYFQGKKYYNGIVRDFSERAKYQQMLIQERNRAQNYLNIAGSVIIVLDHEGNIELINKKGSELFGYPQDEIIGKSWFDHFIPADVRTTVREVFTQLMSGNIEGPEFFENSVLTATGEQLILHWHNALIRDENGKVIGTISSGEDVTVLRAKERELERLNQELEERVQVRTEQLEIANKDLESFSYSVSHDLRAPLRSIDGFSLALLEDQAEKIDEKGRDYLRRIRNASQRMAQLIDDLLRLSRITRQSMSLQEVNISQMAKQICAELAETAEYSKHTVTIGEGILVTADPGLMKIALYNLLQNAFKFSTGVADPAIIVDSVIRSGVREIMIRDNGAGFDMRYAGKLFGVFQRLHTPQEFAGTGIGLTIVNRIIQRHGGSISAEAEPGKGATFYFRLP